ncbi:MAG: Fic family protein [Bacteroidetes bacterium]|nr:Fic family protein [Bacteroidota bacterium]
MQQTINKISQLVAELKALPAITKENQQKLDKKFRLEFNYNSNHIEGNTLTYGETAMLLIFDKTEGIHELREFEEMKAHDVAYKLIQDWAKDAEHPLTEAYIKQLNKLILVRPFWKEAETKEGHPTRREIKVGEYKEYPNSVRLQSGEMFEYASPIDTPIKMGELMHWFNTESEKKELHPVVLAALLHYKFVLIHPFDDGNGRISRLLMNYVLLKNNLPPVIIKTHDKKNYLNALNQADTGNTDAFIKYIAEQVIWSLEIQTKATKGESIEELGDVEKEILLLQKQLKQQSEATQKATIELIIQAFEQNIFPLINTIEKKLEPLFEHFFETTKYIEYQDDNSGNSTNVQFPKVSWSDFQANWLHNDFEGTNKMVRNFRYNFTLKGLKKSVQAQSYWISLEARFNEYNFSITTQNGSNKTTNYPYGIMQDVSVLETTANILVKDVIEGLKRDTNK